MTVCWPGERDFLTHRVTWCHDVVGARIGQVRRRYATSNEPDGAAYTQATISFVLSQVRRGRLDVYRKLAHTSKATRVCSKWPLIIVVT
jgi:hypothetical protein